MLRKGIRVSKSTPKRGSSVVDDEDDFVKGDDILKVSDDEEDHVIAKKKHARLLDSISEMDGQKRAKYSERTVYTDGVSEFGFTEAGAERKVRLHELIGSLDNTVSHGELKKQLKTVNKRTQVASVPLSRVEEGKIQRTTAYEKTKEDISKWNSVVSQNRKAEQIIFPLQQPDMKLQTTDEVKPRFKPRTPLEIEIAALLSINTDTIGTRHAELTPAEERALKAMSLEEAKQRRAELQKYRALLTFKQAKAKREKKIKSKSYHRIQRKDKMKKEKTMLEELQRKDPEAYIDKLEKLERDRVKERMTLKHRGGSKFAQRQKLYGKYDDRSRDAIQNMLQTHSELTKKTQINDNSGSESGVSVDDNDDEDVDDVMTTKALVKGDNPWMNVKTVSEFQRPSEIKIYGEEDNKESGKKEGDVMDELENEGIAIVGFEEGDLESDDDEDEMDDGDDDDKVHQSEKTLQVDREQPKEELSVLKKKKKGETEDKRPTEQKAQKRKSDSLDKSVTPEKKKKNKKGKKKSVVENHAEEIDNLFDNLRQSKLKSAMKENEPSKTDKRKKKKANKKKSKETRKVEKDSESEQEDFMDLSLKRKKTLDDMESGFESSGKSTDYSKLKQKQKQNPTQDSKMEEVVVDPKKLFSLTTSLTNSANVDIVMDEDGEMDTEERQRLTIAQAFADDDVIDEFSKEKRDTIERDKPKDIDLTLPGWGEWGGMGVKPSKRKKKRFTIKAPETAPRRDKGLGNVIISEKIDDAIAQHQVNRLPFPFKNPDQFEQSIRAPIGKNWNPETAFKKLIKPKVVTKLGKIINPIDDSEVLEKQKKYKKIDIIEEENTNKTEPKHNKKQQKHSTKRKFP